MAHRRAGGPVARDRRPCPGPGFPTRCPGTALRWPGRRPARRARQHRARRGPSLPPGRRPGPSPWRPNPAAGRAESEGAGRPGSRAASRAGAGPTAQSGRPAARQAGPAGRSPGRSQGRPGHCRAWGPRRRRSIGRIQGPGHQQRQHLADLGSVRQPAGQAHQFGVRAEAAARVVHLLEYLLHQLHGRFQHGGRLGHHDALQPPDRPRPRAEHVRIPKSSYAGSCRYRAGPGGAEPAG